MCGRSRSKCRIPGADHRQAKRTAKSIRTILNAAPSRIDRKVVSANATPGGLDPIFGESGVVTTNVRYDNYAGGGAKAIATLPDGRLLAVGFEDTLTGDFALARWRTDGMLDATFGSAGRELTDFAGEGDAAHAVVLRPDSGFLVAGVARVAGVAYFALAAYLPDGSLDPAFGVGGKVMTAIGEDARAEAMAVQTDGKILLAGTAIETGIACFALARYEADGSLDASFGTLGLVTTPVLGSADEATAVAIQPDGKIVVGGDSANGADHEIALVRYTTSGDLDPDFGSGGIVTTAATNANDSLSSLALDTDGGLIVAGFSYVLSVEQPGDIIVARYTPAGDLDPSFGSAGTLVVDIGELESASGVAIQGDGKILVGGSVLSDRSDFDFLLLRLHPDGTFDSTFATDGVSVTPVEAESLFSSSSRWAGATALALGTDGKIATAGFAVNGLVRSFAAVRHHPDGTLDTGFDEDGIVTAEVGNGIDEVADLVRLDDGRLVSAGTSHDGIFSFFALTRHHADGTIDDSFGVRGRVVTGAQFDWFGGGISRVFPMPEGKLLAVGETSSATASGLTLARYLADGSLDSSFGVDGVTTPGGRGPGAVEMQQDGKIVVATSRRPPGQPWNEFHVVQLLSDGTIDPSFGDNGSVSTAIGIADTYAFDLLIQPDGKLVVGGRAASSLGWHFALARYEPDGSLDAAFGNDGTVVTTELAGATLSALTLQTDGKLVAAGTSGGGTAVARYNVDGTLDTVFGSSGMWVGSVGGGQADDHVSDVRLQPDRKILVVGYTSVNGPASGIALSRLNPDGTPDDSFGNSGSLLAPSGSYRSDTAVLEPGGKLVVGANSSELSQGDFALIRFDVGPIGGDCLPSPRSCRTAAKSSLRVRNKDDDRRDKLVFKLTRGSSILTEELSDPTIDAPYSLCFYDGESHLIPEATLRIPAGSLWKAAGARGFQYRDRDGAESGVQRMLILGGDSRKSKAKVTARGVQLPAIPLPLPVPLTVQLVNERNGICLGASFLVSDIAKNEADQFKAKNAAP